METYEIKWTSRAAKDLRKIYSFYSELYSEDMAFKLTGQLMNKVDLLCDKRFLKIGTIDNEFSHLKHHYKKLVQKHIKITYRLSTNKPIVYINRVFDTRQNPRKNR